MTTAVRVSPKRDHDIGGLLCGFKWARDSLTFSFPSSSAEYGKHYGGSQPHDHFQGFNATQQAAAESILDAYGAICNLSFTEITETGRRHATLRLAETDHTVTSWGFYPAAAASGGDVWVNRSSGAYDDPVKADYAWLTLIHELGHAMGLKHPHQAVAHFGKMPAEHDSLEYTVMSYRSYVGASLNSYTNDATSYPQTLMMYDIAALQTLYGANYKTNSGNTVYQWDPNSGQMFIDGVGQGAPAGNKIFMTLWDGGGHDTYDVSNYTTAVSINLQPGQWSTTSPEQLAALGAGHLAAGNIANALLHRGNPASLIEDAVGGSADDTIVGNAANNTLTGGGGDDRLEGAAGINTAAYDGASLDYSWSQAADGSWTVVDNRGGSPDGTDTLVDVQYLQFSDTTTLLVPIAVGDSFVTHQRSVVVDVLANDLAPESQNLSAVVIRAPARGTLTLTEDGNFIYIAPKHFRGVVTFTYVASDGFSDSELATVRIKVGASAAKAAAGFEKSAVPFGSAKAHEIAASKGGYGHPANADFLSSLVDDNSRSGRDYLADLGKLYRQSHAQDELTSFDFAVHHHELGHLLC